MAHLLLVCYLHLDPFIHSFTKETPGLFIFLNMFFVVIEKPFLRVKDRLRHRSTPPKGASVSVPVGAETRPGDVDPDVARLFDTSPGAE
jgi:hypothetical protein